SCVHAMMSIFSPRSSRTTAWTREPFIPTQAPTGSTARSREATAILVRSGLADDALDFDDLLGDLRHLRFEQLDDEVRMGPGEDDLHIALRPFHLQQVGFDAIPAPVGLPWNLFVRRQDRLGLAEVDDVVTAFLADND